MSRYFTVGTIIGLQLLTTTSIAAAVFPGQSCTGIANDAERLACYDNAFSRGTVAMAAAVTPVDPEEKAKREFGLSEESKRALDRTKATATQPESIAAAIKSTSRKPTGERIFVLDNGQVWMESQTNTPARVQPGDVVTVRKGALGSYLLVTPKKVATHVRRVK